MPLHAQGLEFVRGLPDHPLLDRIVRARWWIPLLGMMLAGIVAMQVEVLKLNASIGRSLTLSSALQSRNDLLRASVSSLSDAQRIQRLATRLGMVMPEPTSLNFLQASGATASQAAGAIHTANAAAFSSALLASTQQGSTSSTPSGPPAALTAAPTTTTAPRSAASPTPASSGPATATPPTAGATAVRPTPPTTSTGPSAQKPTATLARPTTGGAAPGP